VTAFDLLGALREGMNLDDFNADRIMSKEPITAGIETRAEDLVEMMLENNFTMVPIIKDRRLVGIVDRASLMEAYIEPALRRYVKE
ncbi:MAG: CBS domain-containing protein, partial [Nitrospirota bacterium]